MNLSEIIKREILNSDNLTPSEKSESLYYLDLSSNAITLKNHIEVVFNLEKLYGELNNPEYKDSLLAAIRKYKGEIRKLTNSTEEPITLGEFLMSFNIPTKLIPKDKLDLKLTVGIENEYGCTPEGFHDVIDFSTDIDNGEIKLWI